MLKTLDKGYENFLDRINDKCEVFLNWTSDKLKIVCGYENKYLPLTICTILVIYAFTLIAIAYHLLIH